jgi:lysophospholipase L1-like esterase
MRISFAKRLTTIVIQVVVFMGLAGLIEGGARVYEELHPRPKARMSMSLQPYWMFSERWADGGNWHDAIRGRPIPTDMHTNNWGFAQDFDYQLVPDADYLRRHGKHPGERLVVITGASVVFSVGATSDENTISAQLQRHLNEKSEGVRYRVINIAMGSWLAYQEFVALSLFAMPLDPDWVVALDGINDASAPCLFGSGAVNPMEWPKLLYLTYGGTGISSPLLATLARHSALLRLMSGLRPDEETRVHSQLIVDDTESDWRFAVRLANLTADVEDKQVAFYLNAERNILSLFNRANIMLTTQPLYADNAAAPSYRAAVGPDGGDPAAVELELDKYMEAHKNEPCGPRGKLDDAELRGKTPAQLRGYFIARSAPRLAALVDAAQKVDRTRHIIYRNVEGALPYEDKLRRKFFIDYAHFTDLGHDRVAEFLAENILDSERGVPFDFASFARRSEELAAAAP